MENLEKFDLVALDAAELTQVQGGSPILVAIAVATAIDVIGLGICAAIEYKNRKSKQVKLLENVSGAPK